MGDFFFWGGAAWELLFKSDNAIITIKLLIFFLAIGSQNLEYIYIYIKKDSRRKWGVEKILQNKPHHRHQGKVSAP